jgi:HAD superfamily hydrolase (TIGR01509 family)
MTDTSPRPIKAVVFDLDGLMFNTEEVFNRSGRELLRRRGKELTDEILSGMMGRRAEEAFQVMVDMCELTETIPELRAESEEIFQSLLDEILAPMPGLFELLDHIESHDLPKGVATSSGRNYLNEMLERFEIQHRFEPTLAAEDVTHGKPNPEIYLTAAARIGVDPAEMLVLEDSETGTRAAAASGAIAVAVPHVHSQAHDFTVATHVVNGLNDPALLALFG